VPASIEERHAQIEKDVRDKYAEGNGDAAELLEQAVAELIELRTEYEELQCKSPNVSRLPS